MATIVFSYLITEVNKLGYKVECDISSLRGMENALDIMKDFSMENCLDPLILVVHLPTVSVTNTNE